MMQQSWISNLKLLLDSDSRVYYEILSPLDCAFEVGLADGAVVYEDGRTGTVFL